MNADRACVVLPTYNEHDNLPKIVPQILAAAIISNNPQKYDLE